MEVEVRLPAASFGAFVQGLGWFIGRRVPAPECDAAVSDVDATDAQAGRWRRIRLRGRDGVLSLADAREADVVLVRTTVLRTHERAIRLLKEFCRQFSGAEPDAEPGAAADGDV
jgi:hypothetical protein